MKIGHSGKIVCKLNIWGVEFFLSFKAKYLLLTKIEISFIICITTILVEGLCVFWASLQIGV